MRRRELVLERRVIVDRGDVAAGARGRLVPARVAPPPRSWTPRTAPRPACCGTCRPVPSDEDRTGSRRRERPPGRAPSSARCATSCCAAGATASRPRSCAARCPGCSRTFAAVHGAETPSALVAPDPRRRAPAPARHRRRRLRRRPRDRRAAGPRRQDAATTTASRSATRRRAERVVTPAGPVGTTRGRRRRVARRRRLAGPRVAEAGLAHAPRTATPNVGRFVRRRVGSASATR